MHTDAPAGTEHGTAIMCKKHNDFFTSQKLLSSALWRLKKIPSDKGGIFFYSTFYILKEVRQSTQVNTFILNNNIYYY